jgi:hypothetical protein
LPGTFGSTRLSEPACRRHRLVGGWPLMEDAMLGRVLAVVCGLGAVSGVCGSFTATAHAQSSDESCVGFEKSEDDKALVYEARNSCDQKLSCQLSWLLTCEDNEGKVTAQARKTTRFSLTESGEHTLSLSAAACKQGWSIDDVSWSCNGGK